MIHSFSSNFVSSVCGLSQASNWSRIGSRSVVIYGGKKDLPGLAGVDDVDTISTVINIVSMMREAPK